MATSSFNPLANFTIFSLLVANCSEVVQAKSFVWKFTVSNVTSRPLFSVSPTFSVILPKPETSGRARGINKSYVFCLYHSMLPEIRPLKNPKSRPTLYCPVVSQPNTLLESELGA